MRFYESTVGASLLAIAADREQTIAGKLAPTVVFVRRGSSLIEK